MSELQRDAAAWYGPLPDTWISAQAAAGMIAPYSEAVYREGVLSYGVGPYGYDFRLGEEFKVCRRGLSGVLVDPKAMPDIFETMPIMKDSNGARIFILPGFTFALGVSVEYFSIPADVVGDVFPKSTYARSGLHFEFTPLEPEWCGQITIELYNLTPYPMKIYCGEGIAQARFFKGAPCAVSYAGRQRAYGVAGKYQGQNGITLARG